MLSDFEVHVTLDALIGSVDVRTIDGHVHVVSNTSRECEKSETSEAGALHSQKTFIGTERRAYVYTINPISPGLLDAAVESR
jgi:hypothetical protein